MLLALIRKGICGGGCGNLGQLADIIAKTFGVEGKPYLAECDFGEIMAFCDTYNPLHDYLVIRLKTDEMNPDEYDAKKVTKQDVLKYRDKLCRIVLAIGENLHIMFLTTNPFLPEFSLGPTMRGEDIIEYHTKASACKS
jgi:hypothetical protein